MDCLSVRAGSNPVVTALESTNRGAVRCWTCSESFKLAHTGSIPVRVTRARCDAGLAASLSCQPTRVRFPSGSHPCRLGRCLAGSHKAGAPGSIPGLQLADRASAGPGLISLPGRVRPCGVRREQEGPDGAADGMGPSKATNAARRCPVRFLARTLKDLTPEPDGKAAACKAASSGFDSHRRLLRTGDRLRSGGSRVAPRIERRHLTSRPRRRHRRPREFAFGLSSC